MRMGGDWTWGYLLAVILGGVVLVALFVVVKRRKSPKPTGQATYGGAIRFTDPSGRNMKIVQKDDGTFETMEE